MRLDLFTFDSRNPSIRAISNFLAAVVLNLFGSLDDLNYKMVFTDP